MLNKHPVLVGLALGSTALAASLLILGWVVLCLHVWGTAVLGSTLLAGISLIVLGAMGMSYWVARR